jgi:hypothetical protein
MSDTTHGVCYDSASENYIIFKGTCTITGNDLIPANVNIASHPATVFPTFIFSKLAGTTTGGTIHIEDGIKFKNIIINNEGTINW